MPFESRWLLKDRVRYIRLEGTLTLDDIHTLSSQHEQWIKSSDSHSQIHYIVDTKKIGNYPRNILEIKNQLAGRMARTGWLLLITEDYFIKHIGDVFGQLLHFKVKTSESVLDAYRFLQAMDEIPVPKDWPDINDTMPLR